MTGSFRPQTKPVDSEVYKSFSTQRATSQDGQYAMNPQPRDGETGGRGGGKGKNREDELVSLTGSWIKS